MTFYIISALVVFTAAMVILTKNPLISAIWLILCLIFQSAIFVLLNAHLVAALQVLLYAGAVMVLILFTIMIINPEKSKWKVFSGDRILVGSGIIYLVGAVGSVLFILAKGGFKEEITVNGSLEGVGELLLSKYAVPFELLSLLIIVTVIGTISISRRSYNISQNDK